MELKFKEGCLYRTRDGRKAFINVVEEDGSFYVVIEGSLALNVYSSAGGHLRTDAREDVRNYDLIAEYQELKTEPKPGKRVYVYQREDYMQLFAGLDKLPEQSIYNYLGSIILDD